MSYYDLPPVAFIQKIDGEYGLKLSDDEADFLVWERTGWPEFWPRGFDTPAEAFESQVRDQLRCLADHGSFTPDHLEVSPAGGVSNRPVLDSIDGVDPSEYSIKIPLAGGVS